MPRNTLMQVRRGTTAQWKDTNPTLSAGEWGYDIDTKRYKIGDGLTAWNSLPYASILPNSDDLIGVSGIAITFAATTGIPVKIGVSGIQTSQINDFNTSVSGLLPSITGVSGVNVDFNSGSNVHTISLVDPVVNVGDVVGFGEAVDDRVNSLLVAGSNIQLTYLDNNEDPGSLTVAVTGVSLAGHTHLLTDITDVSASATEVNYLDGSLPGTGVAGKAVVLNSARDVTNINKITTTGDVTVGGNLVVNGSTTIVNSTEVDIGDNIITVNTSGLSTGGFRVYDGSDYQSIIWNNSTNRWEVSGPQIYSSGLVKANTLESTVSSPTAPIVVASTGLVTNLNADLLDGQHGSYYRNFGSLTGLPSPVITGTLTGDVTGSASVTLNQLGNGTLTINTTIAANSVALGTDTTGQYASTVSVAGTGLSATPANADDGTAYTITLNSTPANIPSGVVVRDATGSFTATNITASGFIGNGSSLTDLNASNISTGTLNSARLPGVTQTDTTVGPSGTFVSSVSVDSYGRVTGVNRTTHVLATTSVKGISSFDSEDFSVNAGVVSIKASGVGNSQLEYSKITVGQTDLVLGSSYNAISGISSANPVVLTYFAIDGGTP